MNNPLLRRGLSYTLITFQVCKNQIIMIASAIDLHNLDFMRLAPLYRTCGVYSPSTHPRREQVKQHTEVQFIVLWSFHVSYLSTFGGDYTCWTHLPSNESSQTCSWGYCFRHQTHRSFVYRFQADNRYAGWYCLRGSNWTYTLETHHCTQRSCLASGW